MTRLVLDEISASSLSPNDRILHEGRAVTISEIHDLELDPFGTGRWPADDRARLDVVLEQTRDDVRPRRILMRPDELVLTLRAEPALLILPSEAS